MTDGTKKLRLAVLPAVIAACLALAGCGSSSGDATGLLRETFCRPHKINSGDLQVALSIVPSGSRTLTRPISLTFGGPFQSLGLGKLPKSDLTVTLNLLGHSGSLGIISTGTQGFITFQGQAYQLPQSSFQKLETSFAKFASPPGCSAQTRALGRLNIHPLRWLNSPQVVGNQAVNGAPTTHIHAGINVPNLLADVGIVLQKGSNLGVPGSGPTALSPAVMSAIASAIQNPTFDAWTGSRDKILRRLEIHLTLPVSGQISTALGGLTSAGITLTLGYANLNQPQTITAPSSVQPYSQFQPKLQAFLGALKSEIGQALGTAGGALSGTGGVMPGGGTPTTEGGGQYGAYSQCIQKANGNVAKMQQCAPLLNGGG